MNGFKFKSHGKEFESPKSNPTGRELLEIMTLTPAEDYELFLKIAKREYEPVQPDEVVDLTQPGLEMFRVRRRYEIPYILDDEYFSTYECLITPLQILQENGYRPEQFYLKQIEGHREINYKQDVNHLISLRPNMRFITCKKAPTPVS